MAILDNSIGAHAFITLLGQRIPPMQKVALDDRAGVTGTEFTLLARKGTPFSLISQVDAADYNDAWATYLTYLDLIEQDPVELIQAGISSIVEANYLVKVLAVTPQRLLPIRGAVGHLLAAEPNEGFCECRWDLIAVPII